MKYKKMLVIFLLTLLTTSMIPFAASTSTATIWTDKADYPPEEVVTVYGTGFQPNTPITVNITRPDGHVDSSLDTGTEVVYKVTISYLAGGTTDEYGNFTATYQLDGIQGTYSVVATDGTNRAELTFTDSLLTVNVSPEYREVSPGESAWYEVKVWKTPFTGPTIADLTLTGDLPSGVTSNFPTHTDMPTGDLSDPVMLNLTTSTWTPDGIYPFRVYASDHDNHKESDPFALIVHDHDPEGSIQINERAVYTTSTAVTLSLSYSDDVAVDQVRYSNDGAWDTETWESPSQTKAWSLISGDGLKTVYYQVKDNAGHIIELNDTIFLNGAAHQAIDDAQVRERKENENYGDNQLSVGYALGDLGDFERRTFIKFDLSDLPAGAVITSAKLHLHLNFETSLPIPAVYGSADNWNEETIKWNNRPHPVEPFIGGGSQDNGDYYGLDSLFVDGFKAWGWWFGWDVTSYAQTQVAGDKTLSLCLLFPDKDALVDYILYSSKEGLERNRPWLELYYTIDTTDPTVDIQAPEDGSYLTSEGVSALGQAWDDLNLDKVQVSIDNGVYKDATRVPMNNIWIFGASGLADGPHTITAKATDKAGNDAEHTHSFTVDTTNPTGSITINSNAIYASNVGVILGLSANDANGVASMAFSTDGTSWSAWENYATSKAWVLTGGDGAKTVYVKFLDMVGHESAAYLDSIILDTTDPTVTISAPSDGAYVTSSSFQASGTAADVNLDKVQISIDGGGFVDATGNAAWTYSVLGLADGAHTVTVKALDAAGRYTTHAHSFAVDTIKPISQVSLLNRFTKDTGIAISYSASDDGSGISNVHLWVKAPGAASYVDMGVWLSGSTYTALSGDGLYSFFTIATDKAGNVEDNLGMPDTATILDTCIPTGSIIINSGATWTISRDVSLELTFDDVGGSGVSQVQYSNDGVIYSSLETASTIKAWTLISGDGQKTVYYKVWDAAGNFAVFTDGIGLDASIPLVAINVPTDGSYLNVGAATVSGTASDETGVSKVEVKVDSGEYSMATGRTSWSFTTASLAVGMHTITAKVTDMGGNTADTSIVVYVGATSLTNKGAFSGVYSDPVTVSATLLDLATGNGISGKEVTFTIGTQSKNAYTDANGDASATITLNQASGSYTIVSSFAGTAGSYSSSTDSDPFKINKETATVQYTGDTYVLTAGPTITTAPIRLSAIVTEVGDGSAGNLALSKLVFTIDGTTADGKPFQTTVGNVAVNSAGNALATMTIPIGSYSVTVDIESDSLYWESDIDPEILQVETGSGRQMVTGGGWIPSEESINGKINFAFTVQYNRNGDPKGSFVAVFKSDDGFIYKIKSTSWSKAGLSFTAVDEAFFTCTGVVQKIDRATGEVVESWGNSKIMVEITDGDYKLPQNGRADKIAVTVSDSSFAILEQWGTKTSQILIGGGNIAVHSK